MDGAPPPVVAIRCTQQRFGLSPAAWAGPEAGSLNLNPRYTFRNFIVGTANRLAHAASLSVAERPGHAYNPLFLYGGVGLGKTHLMHAIGNQVLARFPRKRVVYVTSERFTNEFITAIQQGKIDEFRSALPAHRPAAHRRHPVHRRQRTHPGRVLPHVQRDPRGRQADRPLVDRPPKLITTLQDRLRSRFEWGLIADLTAPDLETRIAILRAKAEEQSVHIGADVLEFIARKVISNIRELEGALNRIVAYANMGGMPITIELATRRCSRTCSTTPSRRLVTPERIVQAVSDYYSVEPRPAQGRRSATGQSSCHARSRCT